MKAKPFKYTFLFLILINFIFGNSFLQEALANNQKKSQTSIRANLSKKETHSGSSQKSKTVRSSQGSQGSATKKNAQTRVVKVSSDRVSETVHVVKKGDTLYRIAKQYSITVEDIKRANNLKSERLQLGQKLLIPMKQAQRTNGHPSLSLRSHGLETFVNEPLYAKQQEISDYLYHIVQPGETLYRISLNYGVSLEELKKINNLESNIITVGQKLKIPKVNQESTRSSLSLERPLRDLKSEEDTLQSKFEKNLLTRDRILTPSMLTKEDELALKRKFIELSIYYADSRYRLGGNGDGYLDCSSFVKLIYKKLGINLPRSSAQQFMVGVPVEEHELIPGDLVFFRTRGRTISHVGIYIGDNRFIHISSSRKRVAIDSLDDPYFKKRYAGAKRVLNGEVLEMFQGYLNRREGNRDT